MLFCFCGQSPVDSGDDGVTSFPLHAGDRWEYNNYYYEIPFDNPTHADTVSGRFVRQVIGVDTSSATAGLTVIDDSLTYSFPGQPDYTSINRHWWRITDHDLYEIASGNGGAGGRIRAIFWEQPRFLLDFPLAGGDSWVVGPSDLGILSMRVIDFQNYRLGEHTYYCAIIKTVIDSLPQISITEWYSNSGLIFSHTDYGLSYKNDEIGNIIDSVYSYQDIRLGSIHLTQ